MKYGIYVCLFLFVIGQNLNAGNGNSKGQKPAQAPATTDEGSPSTTVVQTIRISITSEEHIESSGQEQSKKTNSAFGTALREQYIKELAELSIQELHTLSGDSLPPTIGFPRLYLKLHQKELDKEHRKKELQAMRDNERRTNWAPQVRAVNAQRKAKRRALTHNEHALQAIAASLRVPGAAEREEHVKSGRLSLSTQSPRRDDLNKRYTPKKPNLSIVIPGKSDTTGVPLLLPLPV